MRNHILVASLLLSMGSLAAAQPNDAGPAPTDGSTTTKIKGAITKLTLNNESFVEKAALSNLAEIQLSKIALTKSQDAQIKTFAQRMVTDHTAAGNQLKSIAHTMQITVPTDLDSDHQETVDKLMSLSGAEFDAAFRTQMKDDHDKAVLLFTAASDDKSLDAELQAFARKTLPTLRAHQTGANDLLGKHSAH